MAFFGGVNLAFSGCTAKLLLDFTNRLHKARNLFDGLKRQAEDIKARRGIRRAPCHPESLVAYVVLKCWVLSVRRKIGCTLWGSIYGKDL